MNHDCEYFEMQLAEFAGGSLPRAATTVLESHLAVCADCRDELAREMELRDLLGGLPTVTGPRRISISSGTQSGSRVWRWSSGLVAAVLLAAWLASGLKPTPENGATPLPPHVAEASDYTATEINQARREALLTLALTVNVLDHSRDRTVAHFFGRQLPAAVTDALKRHSSDNRKTPTTTNPVPTGGNG